MVLGSALFLIVGVPLTDDVLGEITPHKVRCLVTAIEADVRDADTGKMTDPKPSRARCKIQELDLSWDATAMQLGITDWTASIGDAINADVMRSVSRYMRREHFGSYIFSNVKRS
jgi:hypothetical protein